MRAERGWRLVRLVVLTLFFLEAVFRFLTAIYAKNIDTLRPAPIALLVVFLAPLAYLGFRRALTGRLVLPLGLAVIAFRSLLLPFSNVDGQLVVGGLTVAAYMLYLPVHVLHDRDEGSAGVDAIGFALAFAADATARSLFLGSDPSATPWGWALVLPLAAIAASALARTRTFPAGGRRPGVEPLGRRGRLRMGFLGLGFGAVLGLQLTLLAYPTVLARFVAMPYPAATFAVLAGLGFGIAVLSRGLSPSPRSFLVGNVLAVGAIADLVWFASPLLPVLLAIAEFVVVLDVAVLFGYLRRGPPTLPAAGLAFGAAGAVFVLYLLAFVFALTYAFVPGRPLWEGRLPVFLSIAAVALALPAIVFAHRSRRHGLRIEDAGPRTAGALTVTVTALLVVSGIGSLLPIAPAGPSGPPEVSLMTYNIHQGFGQDRVLDLGRIEDVIRAADADIVALQESDTGRISGGNQDAVRWLAARLGYYEVYGPTTRDQIFGVALLSRHPVLEWTMTFLPSLGAQRVVVAAKFDVDGRVLSVFATHLGLATADRTVQVASLNAITASAADPTILLGDFNTCPTGECPSDPLIDTVPDRLYENLTRRWRDAWTAVGNDPMDPLGFTWPADTPVQRIDYVFTSPGITVEAADVLRDEVARVASDHLPVIARLRLS